MKVTSFRVVTRGAHDHVTVWIDGANAGTLIVGAIDGPELVALLGLQVRPREEHLVCTPEEARAVERWRQLSDEARATVLDAVAVAVALLDDAIARRQT